MPQTDPELQIKVSITASNRPRTSNKSIYNCLKQTPKLQIKVSITASSRPQTSGKVIYNCLKQTPKLQVKVSITASTASPSYVKDGEFAYQLGYFQLLSPTLEWVSFRSISVSLANAAVFVKSVSYILLW